MEEYKNRNGVNFEIEVHLHDNPEADFFGYLFKVTLPEDEEGLPHIYKALVKKEICPSKREKEVWLHNTALPFLERILDTYQDGQTDLLITPGFPDWCLI